MHVIGITGSIASGKSSVCTILTKMGYDVIDADEIAHQVLEQDDDVWAAIAARYGHEVIDEEGRIDRAALGSIIFNDAEEKDFLEATLHPVIDRELEAQIASRQGRTRDGLLFIEAALIFQSGFIDKYDSIFLVTTSPEEQARRLVSVRHLSEEEALSRIEAIAPLTEEQIARCQHIDNSRTFQYTEQQVEELVAQTLSRLRDETSIIQADK